MRASLGLQLSLVFFTWLAVSARESCLDQKGPQVSHLSSVDPVCICIAQNEVTKCDCDDDSLDHLNSQQLNKRLMSILNRTYFRYFMVNLERGCPFWVDQDRCSIRDCSVKTCPPEELPVSLRNVASSANAQDKVAEACAQEEILSSVDTSLNAAQRADVAHWDNRPGDDHFCILDDEGSSECCYIDLSKNPERYTGYVGPSANRVWRTIYEENCFKPSANIESNSLSRAMLSETCFEKKAFFRVISGLHSSISVHLCAQYLNSYGQWGPNVQEYLRRFDDTLTDGEGSHRLSNLYFTYSILLRAVVKAAPRFKNEKFFTGDAAEDDAVRVDIHKLLDLAAEFSGHFDERRLFCGEPAEARRLKEEFRLHFRNISKIMDCVGCEKCRLWGKLQVQGIGTALKILFSETATIEEMKLKRSEIVSLWNAFGRLSSSLMELEEFRKLRENLSLNFEQPPPSKADMFFSTNRPAKQPTEL